MGDNIFVARPKITVVFHLFVLFFLEVNFSLLPRQVFVHACICVGVPIDGHLCMCVETKSLISQPTRQPANPPASQPTKLGPVFFIRKTYLFHRIHGDARGDFQKSPPSNVVFCNKYNEILFFWPRQPSKSLHVCMSLLGRFTFIILSPA